MATRRTSSAELRAGVGPMPRQKVADQILSALRTEIVTGALPRGARLPAERELADQFGVSGPTVREAIRGLSALGLVEVRHGSGAYVAPNVDSIVAVSLGTLVQLEDVGVEDLIRLLGVLNSYAARLAVERATDEEIAVVRTAAQATITGATVDDIADALTLFLTTFVEAAHDRLLAALTRFLVHLVVELEISSHERESDEFWRRWSASAGSLRLAMVERLEQRDAERLVAAVAEYHDVVTERIKTVPALREARLSDPALAAFLARVVADSGRS
jgi:DNA-binding FadR family transcriptional regulator